MKTKCRENTSRKIDLENLHLPLNSKEEEEGGYGSLRIIMT